jgi:hypothetical protein
MAKLTKKQAAIKWAAIIKSVKDSTPAIVGETIEEQVARKKRLEAPGNHEAWFKWYFPKFAYAEPMPFHIDASNRVINNLEWYEVRMWSRELAKSTRTMMEVFYLMFVKGKRNVILTSCTEKQAIKLLRPYKANLEVNQRLIQDYGPQQGLGQWEKAEFICKDGKSFTGVGLGGQVRGSKTDEVRPDILLFDDVDTDMDCRNKENVKNNWAFIEDSVMGTRSISVETTIIFCGNRIALDCCVFRASEHADHTDVINIRDENGVSTWPAKNPEHFIDRVLKQKSYASQQKEYFNNPITEGDVFKKINYKAIRPLSEYQMLVCYTDPSYKDTGDYKATVLIGKWNGEFHIIKAFLEQTTTAKMIDWFYKIMDIVGDKACYYYMEEVFLQDIIKKEVTDTGRRMGRNIPLMGDTRAKPDKYARIESLLEPLSRNGELYFNEDQKADPGMMLLAEQFTAFAPGSRAHDDGPDAVEGGIWIIQNKIIARAAGITVIKRQPNNKRF